MKEGYWIVAYRAISDDSALKAYGALAVPAVQSFGGQFLTRSTSQVRAHEGLAAADFRCRIRQL